MCGQTKPGEAIVIHGPKERIEKKGTHKEVPQTKLRIALGKNSKGNVNKDLNATHTKELKLAATIE